MTFMRRNIMLLLFGSIIILAGSLRFARYTDRFGLAYDQARDAIVARVVLSGKPIPMVGPFSSAGNFTTGPVWYWYVVTATALYPGAVLTPWIVLTASYLGLVAVLMSVGLMIGGVPMAFILGLFTAVSPAQINQGLNLTNPSLVAICSTLALWSGVWYLKSGKTLPLSLFGFALGSAVTAHYQSALIGIFALAVLALKRPKLKQFLLFVLLLAVPAIPLVVFDLTHGFYNFRGVMDYLQYGQFKVYIPNRWLTYGGVFVPYLWGHVIGGEPGKFILIATTGIASLIAITKRQWKPSMVSVIGSFLAMILALRYYRGERYESYFVFLHPFILTISAWACYSIWTKQKIVGALLVAFIAIASLIPTVQSIQTSYNHTNHQAQSWAKLLMETYPGEQFRIYDYLYRSPNQSFPLVLYLSHAGKLSPEGRNIGFGTPLIEEKIHHTQVPNNEYGFDLWDLSASTSAQLGEAQWALINPEQIYEGITQWFNKQK